LKTAI